MPVAQMASARLSNVQIWMPMAVIKADPLNDHNQRVSGAPMHIFVSAIPFGPTASESMSSNWD